MIVQAIGNAELYIHDGLRSEGGQQASKRLGRFIHSRNGTPVTGWIPPTSDPHLESITAGLKNPSGPPAVPGRPVLGTSDGVSLCDTPSKGRLPGNQCPGIRMPGEW